jgi:hypothetical protein
MPNDMIDLSLVSGLSLESGAAKVLNMTLRTLMTSA